MDATHILDSLDVDQIRERLDAIDGERRALMTLLRAARARGQHTHEIRRDAEHKQREAASAH